jgi:hypothetical protein
MALRAEGSPHFAAVKPVTCSHGRRAAQIGVGGGGGVDHDGGLGGGPGGLGMLAIDICTSKDRSNSGIRRL